MNEAPTLSIDGRLIGPGHPPYVICELSGNHNGSLERALKMMEVAAATGCHAIKLQTYTADTITIDHDGPGFTIEGGLWDGRSLHDLYDEAHTPYEWHEALFAKGRDLGVTVFSSPFDETAVDLLETLDAPAYKIASFEAVDLPLIAYVASKGKPMIISTGMCNLSEIQDAMRTARSNGCEDIVLLHCVSSYPAIFEDANLATIGHLAAAFDVAAGLSDHTPGTAASVAAVALGCAVIEKHFTLARSDGGPDAAFSLEPAEFTALVDDTHNAWKAVGRVNYALEGSERTNIVFRRSLYAVADIKAGDPLSRDNVRSIRPGYGLAPKYLPEILGRRAKCNIAFGEPLSWDHVAM
jgi:pseudaminic acid synthase